MTLMDCRFESCPDYKTKNMTIETLKQLIDFEHNRIYSDDQSTDLLKREVFRLLDLFASEQLPDYRRPYIDPAGYYPSAGKEILCDMPDKVPYNTICSCNPSNGGSGMCGCTMGNQMVDNPVKYGPSKTNLNLGVTGTVVAQPFPGTITTNTAQ